MAKAKRLPSGNYRAQYSTGEKNDRGKYIYGSITRPTEKEAIHAALEMELKKRGERHNTVGITLAVAIDKYISSTCNVLSPTTIQAYKKIREFAFQDIMNVPIKKITTMMLNEAVNKEAARVVRTGKKISPKTVRNEYGLVSVALREFDVDINFSKIRLPEKHKKIKELIHPEVIMDIIKDTSIELPVLLAMWLSFSASEIRGLKKSTSVSGDYITIHSTVVDIGGEPLEKDGAKEYDRVRRHKIPPYIKTLIDKVEGDVLVDMKLRALYYHWIKLLKKNNLPLMSFHALRHVNASVMLKLKVPDKYAMERGGWKSPHVMKNIYQHTFADERETVDETINDYFENLLKKP